MHKLYRTKAGGGQLASLIATLHKGRVARDDYQSWWGSGWRGKDAPGGNARSTLWNTRADVYNTVQGFRFICGHWLRFRNCSARRNKGHPRPMGRFYVFSGRENFDINKGALRFPGFAAVCCPRLTIAGVPA